MAAKKNAAADKAAPAKTAAATKPKAEKPAKPAADKKNGVARPRPGSVVAKVWDDAPARLELTSAVSQAFDAAIRVEDVNGQVLDRVGGECKKDAITIGAPAAGGAVIGGIIGGKKGAAIGTAVGGGGGTAAVLTTRGKEVHMGRGSVVTVRLTEPLTVKVRI